MECQEGFDCNVGKTTVFGQLISYSWQKLRHFCPCLAGPPFVAVAQRRSPQFLTSSSTNESKHYTVTKWSHVFIKWQRKVKVVAPFAFRFNTDKMFGNLPHYSWSLGWNNENILVLTQKDSISVSEPPPLTPWERTLFDHRSYKLHNYLIILRSFYFFCKQTIRCHLSSIVVSRHVDL